MTAEPVDGGTGGAASAGPAMLALYSTSCLSDALDRLGIAGQPVGIRPLSCGFSLCGPAWTVQYVPSNGRDSGSVGDFLDDVPAGAVVVIDNGGRLDATVWGDLMTIAASRNGLAGTVIDGVSRDSARALELGYPIFARSSFMRTGKGRVDLVGCQLPVVVGGQAVRPGDILVGDSDGVVIVPAQVVSEVCSAAQEIEEAEQTIRAAMARGLPLVEARKAVGYHGLQARR